MAHHYVFIGSTHGQWQVTHSRAVSGAALPSVSRVQMLDAQRDHSAPDNGWLLRGFTSNLRYAERHELDQLQARQEALNRPAATCAALIPIKKNAAWWALAQDERRAIFEAQSHHTQIGLNYLPAIARQLFHARDLGQPFDFVTWFEFAPEHAADFDALVAELRASPEWAYVEREVDIRLQREN